MRDAGIRRTLAFAPGPDVSWKAQGPQEGSHLPVRHTGYPPARLFAWGCFQLMFPDGGVACPVSPGPCPPSPPWRSPSAWRPSVDDTACILWVFVPQLECEHPSQLASCSVSELLYPASPGECRRADAFCLETLACWEVLGLTLTYISFPILWSTFSAFPAQILYVFLLICN